MAKRKQKTEETEKREEPASAAPAAVAVAPEPVAPPPPPAAAPKPTPRIGQGVMVASKRGSSPGIVVHVGPIKTGASLPGVDSSLCSVQTFSLEGSAVERNLTYSETLEPGTWAPLK